MPGEFFPSVFRDIPKSDILTQRRRIRMAEKIKVPAGVYDMVTRCMEQEFPDNVAIRYVA